MAPCTQHNVSRQSRCRKCGISASGICEHGYRKRRCRICNPAGHLAHISGVRCRAALKNKALSTCKYLGCTTEAYKAYIENQFVDGMSWENHGEVWHIDHIKPLRYDNPTEEDIIERLHYTNTQPLWASENLSKQNKYIG